MRLGVSGLLFMNEPASNAVSRIVKETSGTGVGIDFIEIFAEPPQAYPESMVNDEIQELKVLRARLGISYSLHAPCYDLNPASRNPGARREAARQYSEAIELASRIGAHGVVVHIGAKSDVHIPSREAVECSLETLRNAADVAGRYDMPLLVENTGYGHGQFLHSPGDLIGILDELDYERAEIVMDTGHTILEGFDLVETFELWRPRLHQIHLHSNDGDFDSHRRIKRQPDSGAARKLSAFLDHLLHSDFEGIIMLEVSEPDKPAQALGESLQALRAHSLIRPSYEYAPHRHAPQAFRDHGR